MSIEREFGCTFCHPEQSVRLHFAEYGVARLDFVKLIETDHIFVVPDLLPIGTHVLMIIKNHKYSFAAHPDLADEVGFVHHQLESLFHTQMAFIEHGGIENGGSNQSIYHQHAHIIETKGLNVIQYMSDTLESQSIEHEIIFTPDSSPAVNLQHAFDNQAYLYLQQGNRGIIAHDPDNHFPSQTAQKNLSLLLEGRTLNWKQIVNDHEMAKLSVQKIVNLLERCHI